MKRSTGFFWWDVWMEGWATGLRLAETLVAVPTVVNARLPMIGAAAYDPLTGNWPELYKMVAEKAEAFAMAGLSITRDMQAIQAEMLRPARSGRTAAASSARIGHHAMGAAGRALRPVHAAATGNAKRLRSRNGR